MIARTLTLFLLVCLPLAVSAQPTTFTYQGYLTEAGTAADGAFDFELALYSADTGGTAIDVNAFDDVTVTGGLFSLPADFTGAPFEAGGDYWVEVRVRDGADSGAFTALLPRQAVTASPYAIAAQAVIAPLDVAGDASVQGELTVAGDISTVGEVRAGRVEADEMFSDGPVDLVGGVVMQRGGDNLALLVQNDGPSQPAVRVVGDVEVGGEVRCDGASSCIPISSLAETVLFERAQIEFVEAQASLQAGQLGSVTASCPDAGAILLSGSCPSGGAFSIELVGTEIMNRADSQSPLGYRCRYRNDFSSSGVVEAVAACFATNP